MIANAMAEPLENKIENHMIITLVQIYNHNHHNVVFNIRHILCKHSINIIRVNVQQYQDCLQFQFYY